MYCTLGSWREFDRRDDSNAWRKSTKEADIHKNFHCNLQSKNLSMHLRHHCTNSCQSSSVDEMLGLVDEKLGLIDEKVIH